MNDDLEFPFLGGDSEIGILRRYRVRMMGKNGEMGGLMIE